MSPVARAERARAGAGERRWSVYVLRCSDGTLYTGCTTDLARRLREHGRGRASRYTRSRLPVLLVHSEPCADRSAALRREAEVKRMGRRRKEALASGLTPRPVCLAR